MPRLIAKWERVIGVNVQHFYVQRMKTKWGSCSAAASNFTEPSLVIDSINDAIWTNNHEYCHPYTREQCGLILEILAVDLSRKSVHNQRTSRDSDYRAQ